MSNFVGWQFLLVALVIGLLSVLFGSGWLALRRLESTEQATYHHHPAYRTTKTVSPILFTTAMILLGVALLPPLGRWATQYFLFRVARHLLLNVMVPCLLLMSDPLPAFWHGLPNKQRQWFRKWATQHPNWGVRFRQINNRGMAIAGNIVCTLVWFDPTLHQAALTHRWVRLIEIGVLLAGGFFYWWQISRATPQYHQLLPAIPHILYTGVGALPLKLTGLFFMIAGTPLYNYPTPPPDSPFLTPLQSFHLGGGLIWLLGGVAYSYTSAYFLSNWFAIEEEKPQLPPTFWEDSDRMIAPGFDS